MRPTKTLLKAPEFFVNGETWGEQTVKDIAQLIEKLEGQIPGNQKKEARETTAAFFEAKGYEDANTDPPEVEAQMLQTYSSVLEITKTKGKPPTGAELGKVWEAAEASGSYFPDLLKTHLNKVPKKKRSQEMEMS